MMYNVWPRGKLQSRNTGQQWKNIVWRMSGIFKLWLREFCVRPAKKVKNRRPQAWRIWLQHCCAVPLSFVSACSIRRSVLRSGLSVCLSVRTEELGSHWTDFRETWYLRTSRKSYDKFHVWLKSDNKIGYCTWRPTYIYNRWRVSEIFL